MNKYETKLKAKLSELSSGLYQIEIIADLLNIPYESASIYLDKWCAKRIIRKDRTYYKIPVSPDREAGGRREER